MKDLFIKSVADNDYCVYSDCPIGDIPELLATIVYSYSDYPEYRYYLVRFVGDDVTYKFSSFPECVSFVFERRADL